MRTKFITTGRIIVASICGLFQFMLVTGGVVYWTKFAHASFPEVGFLKGRAGSLAAMVGLLSLVWPMYVFAAAKRTFTENQK
jgi:hypothetical protein